MNIKKFVFSRFGENIFFIVVSFLFGFLYRDAILFTFLILFDFFILRPLISYKRLVIMGIPIDKKEYIKSLGFMRFKYYRELVLHIKKKSYLPQKKTTSVKLLIIYALVIVVALLIIFV